MIAGKTEVSDSQIDWIVHVFLHHTWELNKKKLSKLFEIPENRDCFLRVEYDFMEGLKLDVTDFQQHRHSYRMLGRWELPALSHGYAAMPENFAANTIRLQCGFVQETAQENPWKSIGSSLCSLCAALQPSFSSGTGALVPCLLLIWENSSRRWGNLSMAGLGKSLSLSLSHHIYIYTHIYIYIYKSIYIYIYIYI